MELDAQTIFNAAVSIGCMLGGWVLKSIRESLNQLSNDQKAINSKMSHMEVLIAGDYVRRDAMDSSIGKLESKIDRLANTVETGFERLHSKVDQKVDR